MLHKVHLYGRLGKKYGFEHEFDISSAPEAARAMAANYKGFYEDFKDGNYRVIVGTLDKGVELDIQTLNFKLGLDKPVHIFPVAAGSKGGGGLKIIAGLALMTPFALGAAGALASLGGVSLAGETAFSAAILAGGAPAFTIGGFAVTYGSLASMGLSLLVSGVSSMLTPVPKVQDYGSRNPVDQRPSFIFNAPTNKNAEGTAVPICYGKFRVGSVVISAGITIEQLL